MAKKAQKNVAPENIEAVTKTEAFIDKYKKHIVYCVCGVIVVAAIIICYAQFISKPRAQKANEALFRCESYFQADNYDKALNGDGQGCIGLLQLIDDYGCTDAANLAKLYAGICYAQTDKYEEAAKMLEDYDLQDDAIISPAALGALGNVYAQLGQNDKAIKTLLKAAKLADSNSLTPTFLIQAGELYEAEGQPEKALALYQQIKKEYVNSFVYQEIDKYIERVSK
ncbi:MAG: tetratricopeptide repeat protein [Bacteroidaceae bacterium]|nr:tetratricopeptide repeat protein [Bacteroidaceae bacterium]MBR1755645.1 tetratricopeptide repeat protein [Bacteroidaceae bacterium]